MKQTMAWLVLVAILLVPGACLAERHGKRFLQGLDAYENGDYAAAAENFAAIAGGRGAKRRPCITTWPTPI